MSKCRCPCCQRWRYLLGAMAELLTDAVQRLRLSLQNNREEAIDAQEMAAASACGEQERVIWLRDRMVRRQGQETAVEQSVSEVLIVANKRIYSPNSSSL
jgi:hypothetical protein